MDHLITISCQDIPDNLTRLRDIAEAWSLRFHHWQLEQHRFSVTYSRQCLNYELITTWHVGYYILDQLLAHQANKDHGAEVRLLFSSVYQGDEALLTSEEVQADVPCRCHGEQIVADSSFALDQQLAWEAEVLSCLPHVSSLISVANPEPWATFLPDRCEVRGEGNGVTWYGCVNCNYLVFHHRIIENYGYHGDAVFRTLQCYRCRRRMLREWAYNHEFFMRRHEEWKSQHA